jgi:LysR family transcriptional regulator, glycine cleavage system transcriptional activator
MSKFHLPHLNDLRAFEVAARHQSFKKAGHELHISRVAVSRQIRNLEDRVGHALFERHNQQIVLTEAGEFLLKAVAPGISQMQRALVQLSSQPMPTRLVISADPDFAGLWLVPRLADLHETVPNTLIEILAEKSTSAPQDPRISCAIHYAEADRGIGEMLFRSKLFPVCAEKLRQRAPLGSPNDLRHHVLLHDRTMDEWEEYLRTCGVASDINVRSGIVFSDTSHCMDAAVRGQGVAMGDDFLAANHLSEGRLTRLFAGAVQSRNAYYFSASEDAASNPAVIAFRAWLLRSIQWSRISE